MESKNLSSSWTAPSSDSNLNFPGTVPDSDPELTHYLWSYVLKSRSSDVQANNLPSSLASSTIASVQRSSTSRKSKSRTNVGVSTPDLNVQHKDYREKCLTPRGIDIDISNCLTENANRHFETKSLSDYKKDPMLKHYDIWLCLDPDFLHRIQKEYLFMNHYFMRHEQYSTFALKNLIPQDSYPKTLEVSSTQNVCSRRSELIAGGIYESQDRNLWKSLPLQTFLSPNELSGNLTASPNFSYWLILERKYSDYVHIPKHTHTICERMICPYFTIAISSKDQDLRTSENQILTFGALALYNRHRICRKILEHFSDNMSHESHCQSRHYALTIAKSSYTFWCIRPNFDEKFEWKGCTMEGVYQSNLTEAEGIKHFAIWMNEIHRWGLTTYLDSFQKDLDILLGTEKVGGLEAEQNHKEPASKEPVVENTIALSKQMR